MSVPTLTAPIDAASPASSGGADDPLWYKDAIIYQAHVKSFFDSNNDGIGDFQGFTQRLDYLQGLGVTCLWLLPFFPSPLKDDGYDIADYRNVHPSYGTLDDFQAFVTAAHARNIKVLIELVVNHTSDQHPWFQRARNAPAGSPEREFYVWSDTDKKFPETRIIFTDTEKSNWTYDPVAGQYYWHRFFAHQPDLNHNNPAVVDAVIDVMKFWLDFGVDALRLDAVPYLCVREGTNNENLPETHAVLKRMRAALDASYKNRMLLAEANQWPSDVRSYFGDGDECHMAFHFPLMPRMFMALRQEDRHAITEILSQTPDIPDTSQWALFLRNHDELTLEMVTDEERDYMYSVYAADPQMRLNVGIRRRLAPLVENSRRRMELLNALLFSLPGTPIIYYGDEIGMGDNIYLGDRNGVRTPMQWSSDRNAGFSRADPARLYAPQIMDPVYGYQAINVEAQERYPFSFLNWMKRLIGMRKQHRVFGRGSIEAIGCANRKILAYVRRDERETILVVANLARTLQPVELELRAFAGLLPIEMVGLTEFPRIGDHPYFLTLGPYTSYWFTLQHEPMQMAPKVMSAAEVNTADTLPVLLVGVDWQNVLDSGTRLVLERHALGSFLQRQRWFASKARHIQRARFIDWVTLRRGTTPAFLSIVSVDYSDGLREEYLVPLALVAGEQADRALAQTPGLVLSKITGARKGAIIDGSYDEDTCDRLLALADRHDELATGAGSVAGWRLGHEPLDLGSERHWVRGSSDQSNSVAFVNDRYVLKLFRRIEPTANPELEVNRFLTERRFGRVPSLAGALEYRRPGVDAATLAIVQTAVKHQGTGWDYTIDELRQYYERVSARESTLHASTAALPPLPAVPAVRRAQGQADLSPPPFFVALERWYLVGAQTLGKRTAELHQTLSSLEPPEPLDRPALDAVAGDMRVHAEQALRMLEDRASGLGDLAKRPAYRVLEERQRLLTRFDELAEVTQGGLAIRIHGDYHLGQVLRTEDDFVILDFEGEPGRSLAERRRKQSPLKDVAGMVRSYSYAAYAALFAAVHNRPDDYPVLEPWTDAWQHWASQAFLRGYVNAMARSKIVPKEPAFGALVRAFAMDKAFYELAYELNNRPDWVRIPLAGLLQLAR